MKGLNVSINLLKMKAAVMAIKGKEEVKKCVVIPIEDNDLKLVVKDNGSVSVFLNMNCYETKEESKYGDTHIVKQSHSKEWYSSHSEEEIRAESILGNGKPILDKADSLNVPQAEVVEVEPVQTADGDEELPF